MKKQYIKPLITTIVIQDLCDSMGIGSGNFNEGDTQDSKGHDSFFDWTDNGNDPWADSNEQKSLWDD